MTEEFNLREKRKKFKEDLYYALGKFDWGRSALDAQAITILNTWAKVLDEQDREFIKRLEEVYANCDYDDFDRTFAIDKLRELAGEKR